MSFLHLFGWNRRPAHKPSFTFHADLEQEADGRWIVEITDLPGVMTYGASKQEAADKAVALALRVLADRVEQGNVAAVEGFSLELCW